MPAVPGHDNREAYRPYGFDRVLFFRFATTLLPKALLTPAACTHRVRSRVLLLFAAFFLSVTGVLSHVSTVAAQTPGTISYQGRIESNGTPANGSHVLEVVFYDSEAGGAPLYRESHQLIFDQGVFSCELGSAQPFPSSLTFEKPYYIALRIDGGEELSPRSKLTSVPYALHAQTAELAKGLSPDAKGIVTSINELTGAIHIAGDSTTVVTQNGGEITIHSVTTPGSGLKSIQNLDHSLTVQNAVGPKVTLSVADGGITTQKIADGAVTPAKIAQAGAAIGQTLKWNGTTWVAANDDNALYTAGQGIAIINGAITNTGSFAIGSVPNSTLRWDGSTWVENQNFLSNAIGNTQINGGLAVGDGFGADNITLNPGSGSLRIVPFSLGVVKSSNNGTLTTGAVDLGTTDVQGVLPVSLGGTGLSSIPANSFLMGNGTSLSTVSLSPGPGVTLNLVGSSLQISSATGINWSLSGNAGTLANRNFIGTTDLQDLAIRTNNLERVRIDAIGRVGIGSPAPTEKLEVRNGNLLLSNSNTPGELRISGPSDASYSAFTVGNQSSNITYTLPTTLGRANQLLSLGSIAGGRAQLSWIDPPTGTDWSTTGNAGSVPGSQFLGTTDNVAFEIHVNESGSASYGNRRVMRFEPSGNSPNIIGGYNANMITTGKWGSVIAGGGFATEANRIDGNVGVIAGGANNQLQGAFDIITGGESNRIVGQNSSIAGGSNNFIQGSNAAVLGSNDQVIGDWSLATGTNLTLGSNSFGFNGKVPNNLTDLSQIDNIAYFGNVDLLLSNVDSRARELRFYAPNTSSNLSQASYSSFKAGAQSSTINYTLPLTAGQTNQVLSIVGVSGKDVTLGWTVPGAGGFWNVNGNSNLAAGSYMGTNDNSPLELHVFENDAPGRGSKRVVRYEPNASSPNIIAGFSGNTVRTGVVGGAVLSGGFTNDANSIYNDYGVIAGGAKNQAGDAASTAISANSYATVGGGLQNAAQGQYSFVGGGTQNIARGAAATMTGGAGNTLLGDYSVIAGGSSNTITSSGQSSVISGGTGNTIAGSGSTIAGGKNLKLGNGSFGFNGSTSASLVDLSGSSQVAYLGDVNLLIGNVDGTARELRFQSPTVTSPATAAYTAFKAANQPAGNITYTLPSILGTPNQVLGLTAVTGGQATLSWMDPSTNSWSLNGNNATSTGQNFLGTTDNAPFEIHVYEGDAPAKGSKRVMRFEPTPTSPNLIGGSSGNRVRATSVGVTIAGGGDASGTNPLYSVNTANDNYATVSGGAGNRAGDASLAIGQSSFATISGGLGNYARGAASVVSGGSNNFALATNSTVGGGASDTVNSDGSTIAGGTGNRIDGRLAVVAGGRDNKIDGNNGAILGGARNIVRADYGAIVGGFNNSAGANSTVIGGSNLRLGSNSVGFSISSPSQAPDLSAKSGIGYFGNVNLIVGNTDNSARGISLLGPNTSADLSGAFTTMLRAGQQSANIVYTLPLNAPSQDGNILLATAGSVSSMSWSNGLLWDNTNSRLGIGTTTPQQTLDVVNTRNSDESAAVLGTANAATVNQAVGVWGAASSSLGTNTGTIGVLATGNSTMTAGQTNVALQINSGEFAMGRTTEPTLGAMTVENSSGGAAYTAEGPSGVLEFNLGTTGSLVTSSPVASAIQNLGNITITNRYCQPGSIVLVNVVGMSDDGNAPDPRDAAFIVNADNTGVGSFTVRVKMIPTLSSTSNYSANDKVRIGYIIVNKSR